jgi:hypothetical protein
MKREKRVTRTIAVLDFTENEQHHSWFSRAKRSACPVERCVETQENCTSLSHKYIQEDEMRRIVCNMPKLLSEQANEQTGQVALISRAACTTN